jgi:hypothetical protein
MEVCLKQQQNINKSQFRGANIKKERKEKKKTYALYLPLQSMHYCTMDCIKKLHVYDNVHGNNFISLYHVLMLVNSEQF